MSRPEESPLEVYQGRKHAQKSFSDSLPTEQRVLFAIAMIGVLLY